MSARMPQNWANYVTPYTQPMPWGQPGYNPMTSPIDMSGGMSMTQGGAPGMGGMGPWGSPNGGGFGGSGFPNPMGTKLGFNTGTLQGLGSLAQTGFGIFTGLKQLSLAKEAQRVGMAFANRNLENQTKTLNMALEDRTTNRQRMYEGTRDSMTPEMARAYLEKNRFNTAAVTSRG